MLFPEQARETARRAAAMPVPPGLIAASQVPCPDEVYVNVGATQFAVPGWTLVDKQPAAAGAPGQRFVSLDLLDGCALPWVDGALHGAYTSHLLEHLSNASVAALLVELRRALRPGAVLRITVPDAAAAIRAYHRDDPAYFTCFEAVADTTDMNVFLCLDVAGPEALTVADRLTHQLFSQRCRWSNPSGPVLPPAALESLPTVGYEPLLDAWAAELDWDIQRGHPQMHCNWWDEAKLRRALKAAGFDDIRVSGYLQSHDPKMRIPGHFDATAPDMSLFMEATHGGNGAVGD